MTAETTLKVLGLSQLIQAPATAMLASDRVLGLRREIERLSPINGAIVRVLGGAVVVVLVALGLLVAIYPADVVRTDFGRALTLFLGAFWTTRFLLQIWYGRRWPARAQAWHYLLLIVFLLQGPGYLLAWAKAARGDTTNACISSCARIEPASLGNLLRATRDTTSFVKSARP